MPSVNQQASALDGSSDPEAQTADTAPARSAAEWAKVLSPYREPHTLRGFFELAVTVTPLILLWAAMWWALDIGYWLVLLLALPTAGFLVRMFMVQHDCGHGSFFRSRSLNDWVGRIVGVVTLTPYDYWQRTHALHHAGSGNLARRGFGDIDTLTVREYRAMGRWGRLRYRIYRHPIVMFGLGPIYLFVLRHRMPFGLMRKGWTPWISTMATNAAITLTFAGLAWLVGTKAVLLVHAPVLILAASLGVWLFYVQHQFENTHWAHDENWSVHEAALRGSSHYALPLPLRWLTANIGVHHVHHLSSRIPSYRLQRVIHDHPSLGAIGRVTLARSLRSIPLVLWDEQQRRLISFREARYRA